MSLERYRLIKHPLQPQKLANLTRKLGFHFHATPYIKDC